jgi:hypothetical protein
MSLPPFFSLSSEFLVKPSLLASRDAWKQAAATCPGTGQGHLHERKDAEARLAFSRNLSHSKERVAISRILRGDGATTFLSGIL